MLRLALTLCLLASPLLADESFLVRFGGAEPADWSGSLEVDGGSVVALDGWQFDQADRIVVPLRSWSANTVVEEFWHAPWERSLEGTKQRILLSERGLILRLSDGAAQVRLETAAGEIAFEPREIGWQRPAMRLGGQVRIERVPVAERVPSTAGPVAEDEPSAIRTSAGETWLAWQSYVTGGDQLFVQRGDRAPEALTAPGRHLFRVHLAESGDAVWAIWSEMRDDDWDLRARRWSNGRWAPEQTLVDAAGNDIFHSVASGPNGRLALVWQSFRDGQGEIYGKGYDGERWTADARISRSPANDWDPAVAFLGDDVLALWDGYQAGNYDVFAARAQNRNGEVQSLLDSPSFEARPQILIGSDGNPWFAWEEGDSLWGKDYVSGGLEAGMGLLMRREVRVGVYLGGELKQLPGEPSERLPDEAAHTMTTPRLAFDGNGNPWVFFRYRTNTPRRQKPTYRSMWRLGAVTFHDGGWSDLIRFPVGYGRIDAPTAVAANGDGGFDIFWPGDGRTFPQGFPGEQDLFRASVQPGPPAEAFALIDYGAPTQAYQPVHEDEAADVERLRSYRAESEGRTYRIVRGDMHRHTDISWDGNRDGSLFDSYRYALDAASMDYQGVADHNAGEDVEYNWRMGQRGVDLFQIPGRFTPLYGYERSRSYPSGHRNVMFAQRGVPVFGFLPNELSDNQNAGLLPLYAHLKQERGVVMAHTVATGAGTDWTDSDPEVEPLVEIYQGYRTNYEHEGAPRADDPIARPAGLVWNAWQKGLKLGLQASSDHVSTHASYGMIWVEEVSREAILDGIRARRSYAATDNILVDFRVDGSMMGSVIRSSGRPRLTAKVVGARPIDRIEVIRNNQYVHTHPGGGSAEVSFEYVDNSAPPGESWYYIRVEQEDGELAWASPVWVTVE